MFNEVYELYKLGINAIVDNIHESLLGIQDTISLLENAGEKMPADVRESIYEAVNLAFTSNSIFLINGIMDDIIDNCVEKEISLCIFNKLLEKLTNETLIGIVKEVAYERNIIDDLEITETTYKNANSEDNINNNSSLDDNDLQNYINDLINVLNSMSNIDDNDEIKKIDNNKCNSSSEEEKKKYIDAVNNYLLGSNKKLIEIEKEFENDSNKYNNNYIKEKDEYYCIKSNIENILKNSNNNNIDDVFNEICGIIDRVNILYDNVIKKGI